MSSSRLIQDPLALKFLDGDVLPGDTITVDADSKKGAMTFARAKAISQPRREREVRGQEE